MIHRLEFKKLVRAALREAYAGEAFVKVRPDGTLPAVRAVRDVLDAPVQASLRLSGPAVAAQRSRQAARSGTRPTNQKMLLTVR